MTEKKKIKESPKLPAAETGFGAIADERPDAETPRDKPGKEKKITLGERIEQGWQKAKLLAKATPEISRALWHDKNARQQIGETIYATLTTVGGVKLLTDFLRLPLGKKMGEQAGGDIYKKTVDVKERKQIKQTAADFVEILIQTETARCKYREIKTKRFAELLTERKATLKKEGINWDNPSEEHQEIIQKIRQELLAQAKEEARKAFLEEGGSAEDLANMDALAQKAKDLQGQNKKLFESGRLSQENSSLIKHRINKVFLEHKRGERTQEKKRTKEVEKAVNGFVEDKVKGTRLAADAWNTFATMTGIGIAMPLARGGGYIGLDLVGRLQKSHRHIKQQDAKAEYRKWRKIDPEAQNPAENMLHARESYCRRLAVGTARECWQDLRALGLKGRTQETEKMPGVAGKVRRITEMLQSLGSLTRAGSLLLTGLRLERTDSLGRLPEILSEQLAAVYRSKGEVVFDNLAQNLENTVQNYKRVLTPETYVSLAKHIENFFPEHDSKESLIGVAEAATMSSAVMAGGSSAKHLPLFEEHRVKKGESLWALAEPIAKKTGTPIQKIIENIKEKNHLASDTIKAGQGLQLPSVETLLREKTAIRTEGLRKLPELVKNGIGTPYSSENNCLSFLRHCFEKAGLDFSDKDFSYAGEMIEHLGKPVRGANVANFTELKNHPGDYLIAFGYHCKPSNAAPAMDTWNHAGYVRVDKDGSITLTHASSNSIQTADGRFLPYNEYRVSNGIYYDSQGERLNVIRHRGEKEESNLLKNGWVAEIPLEEYLQNVKWSQIALTRLDGETITLQTPEQPPLDISKFSPRQLKVMETLEKQPVEVLNKAKRRSEIFRCSSDVAQRLRLISRGLPEALHLSIKGTAIIDAPQAEKAILSSGGNIAATLQDTIAVQDRGGGKRLVFLEKFGQESDAYKQNAREWLRQAAKDPLGFATFTHEGTSIERQIIAGLPAGNGINSHLVLLLGEKSDNIVADNNQSVGECIEKYFGLDHDDFKKSAWVFEGLGLKMNGREIAGQNNWENLVLKKGDKLEIKDISFNDNVGGKVRTGSFISHFFLKDHAFHPVAVLRPNAKVMEQALSSFELPVKVVATHQVKEGESLAGILKSYKIPPASQGDVLAYLYSQGIDAKNLRAGSLIALPDLADLKNNHEAVIETAEHRLDEQSWLRKERYDHNVVVASADTPQKTLERLLDKKLSREEATGLMRRIIELEKDKPEREKTFLLKDGRVVLRAGDVLTLPKQKIEAFETALDQERQRNLTHPPQELTLNIQGKDKIVRFSEKETSIINGIMEKNPELNGHIPEYLSVILAQEQKRGSWRKLAKDIIGHLDSFRRIPILGKIIPRVHSVGIFQVRANESIADKLQESFGKEISLPKLSRRLSGDGHLNGLVAAIMAQDHINNLQNALRAFGQETGPGETEFDLAIINSHNRGLNKTLFGTLELRIKDLAIASGEGPLWQKHFNTAKISGNNKERDAFDDFFRELALNWQKKGLLDVPPSQINQDTAKIKTNLTDFLKSPTLQAFKQAYPRLKNGQEMLILPNEKDIARPDFNACNYASLAAKSRVFAQMSGRPVLAAR
ncbi:MAG: LysM peptidoglycan-binding domain-containing protein [Candidatus Pacebacteria bacterium]|nr:LysM peptidoglycan-binding domain-containing protein [Candidatus Paceibacterota bacterium]